MKPLRFSKLIHFFHFIVFTQEIGDYMTSSDFKCPCGCSLVDGFGNEMIKEPNANCTAGLANIQGNAIECVCGCDGVLPSNIKFSLRTSPGVCTKDKVTVNGIAAPECLCGCKNKTISGLQITVKPKNTPECKIKPTTSTPTDMDYLVKFILQEQQLKNDLLKQLLTTLSKTKKISPETFLHLQKTVDSLQSHPENVETESNQLLSNLISTNKKSLD